MSFNEDSLLGGEILSSFSRSLHHHRRESQIRIFQRKRTSKLVSISDGDKANARDICCGLCVITHMCMYLHEMHTRLRTLTRVHWHTHHGEKLDRYVTYVTGYNIPL